MKYVSTAISGVGFFEDKDPLFIFRGRGVLNCALKRTGYNLNYYAQIWISAIFIKESWQITTGCFCVRQSFANCGFHSVSSFLEQRCLVLALPQYLVFIRAEKESMPSSRLATVAEDRTVESSHCSHTVFTLHMPCLAFISLRITFYWPTSAPLFVY